jgi:hypothetical protein
MGKDGKTNSNETASDADFGSIDNDGNAFGVTVFNDPAFEDDEQTAGEQKPASDEQKKPENEQKPGGSEQKKPENEQKPDSDEQTDKKPKQEEIPSESQEEVDEYVEKLKSVSPVFKDLCEKKKFKTVDDAFTAYIDLEKGFTRKSQQASSYKKLLDDTYTFDDDGNITGYKQKAQGQDQTQATPEKKSGADSPQTVLSAGEQAAQLKQLSDSFFEQFDNNPVETLLRITTGVVEHYMNSGVINNLKEQFKGDLKPLLDRESLFKAQEQVRDFIDERVKSGDDKAPMFFQTYANDIRSEIAKTDPNLRSVNPRLVIEQAYSKVRDAKLIELQNTLREKEKAAVDKRVAAVDTGDPAGGGSSVSSVDPDFQADLDFLQKNKNGSAFFGF